MSLKEILGSGLRLKKVVAVENNVDITGVHGFVFLVDEGLILFEHFGYVGERKVLRI